MDYSLLNIFLKEKFELGSKNRNRTFRFIRYNGANYTEIKKYLNEKSPNTIIWPEKKLVPGKLYYYSGRDFKMNVADELLFRAAIVNNPFLISESGEWISLKLTRENATEYLAQSKTHSVFHAKAPLATFVKKDDNRIYEYSSKHKRGYDKITLPNTEPFFICDKTYCHNTEDYIFNYDEVEQELEIKVNFSWYINRIEKLKYKINSFFLSSSQCCFFEPKWNYWKNIEYLSKECNNGRHMNRIISIICSSILSNEKKYSHLEFNDNKFQIILTNLRNHNFEDNAYISEDIANYLIECTGSAEPPACPNDFQDIQKNIYKDTISFLEDVKSKIVKPKKGLIQEDEDGILYCKDTEISKNYSKYKGLKCEFTRYYENTNCHSKYRYFCSNLDYIHTHIQGEVKIDSEHKLYIGEYKFPIQCDLKPGCKVCISKIEPVVKSKYSAFVIDYTKIEEKESEFLQYILPENKKAVLEFLHQELKNRKNTKAARFIVGAIKAGLITKPTYTDFDEEFKDCIANDDTLNKQYRQNLGNICHDDIERYKKYCEEWKEKNNI